MQKENSFVGVFVLVLLGLVLVALSFLTNKFSGSTGDFILLDEGWTISVNSEVITGVNLGNSILPMANEGDKYIISRVLPNEKVERPELDVLILHSAFDVFLDDKCIYSYGYDILEKNGFLGYGRHSIMLPDSYMGKTLTISMDVAERNAFASIDPPQIYDAARSVKDYLFSNRIVLVIDIFLVATGLCISVIAGIWVFLKKELYKILFAALIAVTIGLWSLGSYDLIFIFVEGVVAKSNIEYLSLYLAPMFLLLYFRDECALKGSKLRRNIYLICCLLQFGFVAISLVLHVTNIIHFPNVLTCQHILMLTMGFYILCVFIYDIRKKDLHKITVLTGTAVMVVFGVFDVLHFNMIKYVPGFDNGSFHGCTSIGTLVLVISLILDYIQGIIRTLYESAQNAALAEMAYKDPLTGLANRRVFEECFDEIDDKDMEFAIISFDLNDLKEVNDTLGHNVGDEYIRSFAEILKNACKDNASIIRTGGDEFTVILKCPANENKISTEIIDNVISGVNRGIDKLNRLHKDWHMSTAYGICSSNDGVRPSRVAYKYADERMYEQKVKMKEGKKR